MAITSQLPVAPGQRVEVWIVRFAYQGPARQVVCGWALKPRTSLFGTNWNNGLSTIAAFRAFSGVLNIPASGLATPFEAKWPTGSLSSPFGFIMPTPGTYRLEGSGTGEIAAGGVDTWVWLADVTLIQSKGLALSELAMMDETNLLVIDTDAGPVRLGVVAGSALQVGYRNGG